MKLLLVGQPSVGKTSIGNEIAKRLRVRFFNVDMELINTYGSVERFQELYPDLLERYTMKYHIAEKIIMENEDCIVAISPLYDYKLPRMLYMMNDTICIYLKDTCFNIYKRMIFTDEFGVKLEVQYA